MNGLTRFPLGAAQLTSFAASIRPHQKQDLRSGLLKVSNMVSSSPRLKGEFYLIRDFIAEKVVVRTLFRYFRMKSVKTERCVSVAGKFYFLSFFLPHFAVRSGFFPLLQTLFFHTCGSRQKRLVCWCF